MQFTKSIKIRTRTENVTIEIDDTGQLFTTFGEPSTDRRDYLMEIELLLAPDNVTKTVRWDLPTYTDPYEVVEPPPEP